MNKEQSTIQIKLNKDLTIEHSHTDIAAPSTNKKNRSTNL